MFIGFSRRDFIQSFMSSVIIVLLGYLFSVGFLLLF